MRAVSLVCFLVGGALSGTAAVMLHQRWWALALIVVALMATVLAVPSGWWTRLPFAVGFVAVLGLAMLPRGEGDYLVGADPQGYTMLGLGFALFLVSAATLPRPGRSLDSHP